MEKVLEETLAGSNSDTVKSTLRCLRNFQNGPLPLAIFGKLLLYRFVN